jgi:DNA-binding HxlR family transcriptional regulator
VYEREDPVPSTAHEVRSLVVTIATHSSYRPISFALDLFVDRWTLLVERDLASKGKISFSELRASDAGIARNSLADRLASLVADGFIEKQAHPNDGRRSIHRPTSEGSASFRCSWR